MFIVTDEYVILVATDDLVDVPVSERLHLPQPSIDMKGTQQLLDYFAQCIEMKGPILVDQLFHMVTSKFPQEQWFRMFKTPSDLTTFLKLFSDCFHIQSNLVTLLQKPKLSEAHIQQAQASARDQFNNNHHFLAPVRPTVPHTLSPNHLVKSPQQSMNLVGDFKLNEPVSVTPQSGGNHPNHVTKSQPNSGFDSLEVTKSEHEMFKLENLCESNCPKSSTGSYYTTTNSTPNQTPTGGVTAPVTEKPAQHPPVSNKNQSLKQRINSLVIKTLAENLEKDKQSMAALQTTTTSASNNADRSSGTNSSANSSNSSPVHSNNYFVGDTWKIKVLQNTRVIATIRESSFVTEAIMKSAHNSQVVVSFDCEGINLGSKGQLTLLEIGTTRGEAFIFDILTCPELLVEGGLKNLLESDKVIKVIHDCRNDAANLFHQYNILLKNVFDTQVGSSFLLSN